MDKMIMTIIPDDEAEFVLNALINAGYTATFAETKGGMLRQTQLTMFIAARDENLEDILSIIKENCRLEIEVSSKNVTNGGMSLGPMPVKKGIGGAIVFIWDIDRIETY